MERTNDGSFDSNAGGLRKLRWKEPGRGNAVLWAHGYAARLLGLNLGTPPVFSRIRQGGLLMDSFFFVCQHAL